MADARVTQRWIRRLAAVALWCAASSVGAQVATKGFDAIACPDAQVLGTGMITNVCWSCMFPVTVAGIHVMGNSSERPSDANSHFGCACAGDLSKGRLPTVGITLGMWQPTRIIELVRRPYCFPALAGTQLSHSLTTLGAKASIGGEHGATPGTSTEQLGMYNFHLYSFPLLAILQLADIPGCYVGGYSDFSIMYMSEAFPNWYMDELSFLIQPESLLFANPLAQSAMVVDCAASTLSEPIDELFWVAGCWGGMYPFTGNFLDTSGIRASSLVSARALAMLGRLGMIDRTVGDDATCEPKGMRILKKTQYRMQMMFPTPESNGLTPPAQPTQPVTGTTIADPVDMSEQVWDAALRPGRCCHPMGKSSLVWGEWRGQPGTGEDYVYLLWQWIDCCLGTL